MKFKFRYNNMSLTRLKNWSPDVGETEAGDGKELPNAGGPALDCDMNQRLMSDSRHTYKL
jgi:hypothetical protein